MEFASKKAYVFLALQASIKDLKLEKYREALENLMAETIQNKVKKALANLEKKHPKFDPKKDEVKLTGRQVLINVLPLG